MKPVLKILPLSATQWNSVAVYHNDGKCVRGSDMLHVDQITLLRCAEVPLGQLRRKVSERRTEGIYAILQVQDGRMVLYLEI